MPGISTVYREIQALIRHGLSSLSLLHTLFFEEKTERQYADELGVYRNVVHVRKMKALKKLKLLWRDKSNAPHLDALGEGHF